MKKVNIYIYRCIWVLYIFYEISFFRSQLNFFSSGNNFVDIYSNHDSSYLISVLVLQKFIKIDITYLFSPVSVSVRL